MRSILNFQFLFSKVPRTLFTVSVQGQTHLALCLFSDSLAVRANVCAPRSASRAANARARPIIKMGFSNRFSVAGLFFASTCRTIHTKRRGECLPADGSDVSTDLHLLLGMNRRRFVDSLGGRGAVSPNSPRSQITASQGPQEV